MTGRRGLVLSLLGCLAGGGVVVLASGRVWAARDLAAATGARVHAEVTGRDVAGSLPAIGTAIVVLALAAFAVRGWPRRLVGVLVVVLSATAAAVVVTSRSDVALVSSGRAFAVAAVPTGVSANAWSWVALAGAVLAACAGACIAVLGHRWPGLGRRYEPPVRAETGPGSDDATVWSALDRGEDPTV